MDTTLIYQALEQPSLRKQIPIAELERIQATYPYFTAAQVLLAKIYQENKDHRYADQLQQAALYAIDRKVLSEYMRGPSIHLESPKGDPSHSGTGGSEEVNVQNEKQNENENELRGETVQNEKQNENELRGREQSESEQGNSGEYVFITDEELSIFEGKGRLAENEEENQNQNQNENELREEVENQKQNENSLRGEREEENQIEEKSARVEMSDFDREILIEAVQSSIEMEVGQESEEEGKRESEEVDLSTGSRTVQKQNENELRGENEEEIRRIEAKDPSELTFGELMMLKAARMGTNQNQPIRQAQGPYQNENELRGRDQSEVGNQNDNENENELRGSEQSEVGNQNDNENELRGRDQSEVENQKHNQNENELRGETGEWGNEERTEERGKNFDYLYKLHNGGLAPIDAPNEKEKQKSIIDRFIKLEPKITPGKVSEYNTASNLAKESLEEDFSFATETMAKLFIAQGKFDKAKKVYRKLMELHPEKNVYFAAQLKNLNQNKKQ